MLPLPQVPHLVDRHLAGIEQDRGDGVAEQTNTTVWAVDPASCIAEHSGRGQPPKRPTREAVCSGAELGTRLPAESGQRLRVRAGAKGPLVFEFAAVRAWAVRHRKPGPPVWGLIRRSREEVPEVKYYVSDGDEKIALKVLALVACSRHPVEDFFEDCKGHLGMAQYETRSWIGWHHHMTLVGLAHLFVTLARRRLKKKSRS